MFSSTKFKIININDNVSISLTVWITIYVWNEL